jgi:alanine-alpha-ketoisovalerate/valine-pyruvate aminotransferase
MNGFPNLFVNLLMTLESMQRVCTCKSPQGFSVLSTLSIYLEFSLMWYIHTHNTVFSAASQNYWSNHDIIHAFINKLVYSVIVLSCFSDCTWGLDR